VKKQNFLKFDGDEPKARVEVARVLLEHGADVTARDDTYSMPLHLISSTRSPEVARLLIEHGADVNALDGSLKAPLHLASSSVSVKTARLLSQHRADMKRDGL
jgi:ankyrin repeat protein